MSHHAYYYQDGDRKIPHASFSFGNRSNSIERSYTPVPQNHNGHAHKRGTMHQEPSIYNNFSPQNHNIQRDKYKTLSHKNNRYESQKFGYPNDANRYFKNTMKNNNGIYRDNQRNNSHQFNIKSNDNRAQGYFKESSHSSKYGKYMNNTIQSRNNVTRQNHDFNPSFQYDMMIHRNGVDVRRQNQKRREKEKEKEKEKKEPDTFESIIDTTNRGIQAFFNFQNFNYKWLIPIAAIGISLSMFHVKSRRVLSSNIIHFPIYVGFSLFPLENNKKMNQQNVYISRTIQCIEKNMGHDNSDNDTNDTKNTTMKQNKKKKFLIILKNTITSMKLLDVDQYLQLSLNVRELLRALADNQDCMNIYNVNHVVCNRSLDLDILLHSLKYNNYYQQQQQNNNTTNVNTTHTINPNNYNNSNSGSDTISTLNITNHLLSEIEMWCEVEQSRFSQLFRVPIFPVRKFIYKQSSNGDKQRPKWIDFDNDIGNSAQKNQHHTSNDIDPINASLLSMRNNSDAYKQSWRYGICIVVNLCENNALPSSSLKTMHVLKLECEEFTSLLHTSNIEEMGKNINQRIKTLSSLDEKGKNTTLNTPYVYPSTTQLILLLYTRPINIVGL